MILLGVATGMRSLTPIAVFCWFTWLALLPVTGLTSWTANIVAVIVFTALALGEYYGDTLPQIPSRTALVPLLARIALAVLIGVLAASSLGQPLAGGILLALIGVLIGAYGGRRARAFFARLVGHDLPVALCESALALLFSVLSIWRIAFEVAVLLHSRYGVM